MAVVVDASIAAAWCFRDEEGSGAAEAAIARLASETGIVPGLFWHEMRHVLVVAERKDRIDHTAIERHLYRLRSLPLITDEDQRDNDTVALARRHGLSAYDAVYLETAKRHGADLATLDLKLATALAREGL